MVVRERDTSGMDATRLREVYSGVVMLAVCVWVDIARKVMRGESESDWESRKIIARFS
jgi:hypothetical protein